MHHGQHWLDLVRGGRARCLRTHKAGIRQVRFLLYLRLPQGPTPWITGDGQVVRPNGSGLSGRSWKSETSFYCGITIRFPLILSSCPLLTLRECALWRPRIWMVKLISSQGNPSLPPPISCPRRISSDFRSSWIANLPTRISTLTSRSYAIPTLTAKTSKSL